VLGFLAVQRSALTHEAAGTAFSCMAGCWNGSELLGMQTSTWQTSDLLDSL
jgi:hypothetical protein